MTTGIVDPAFAELVPSFRALRERLDAIDGAADRRIALDAVRNALDRQSDSLVVGAQPFLAGSFAFEALVHAGPDFEVHRARQRDLGTLHAVKTVAALRRTDPVLRTLLLREARHHLSLRHPAILAAEVCLRLDDGRPALLTAWCDAPTLGQRLIGQRFGSQLVLALAHRLTEGLAVIHAAGLLHLDLSPANIFLPGGEAAAARIADFGLSLPIGGHSGEGEIALAGTLGFTAPEAEDPARPLDARADLFALGAVLRATLAPDADDALADALRETIDRLCQPDPTERPPSAAALQAEWSQVMNTDERSG